MFGTLACCSGEAQLEEPLSPQLQPSPLNLKKLSKILSIAVNPMLNDVLLSHRMFWEVGAQKRIQKEPFPSELSRSLQQSQPVTHTCTQRHDSADNVQVDLSPGFFREMETIPGIYRHLDGRWHPCHIPLAAPFRLCHAPVKIRGHRVQKLQQF